MPIQAVLFDVDGVLLQSQEAMYNMYQDCSRLFALPQRSREDVQKAGGLTDREFLRTLAPKTDEETMRKAESWCIENYADTYLPVHAVPTEGLKMLLDDFRARGIRKGVVTNQARNQAKSSLRIIGVTDFDAVVTWQDVVQHKPSGEPILKALDHMKISPKNAIYVGDTKIDVDAGRDAGVKTYILEAPWNAHIHADKISALTELMVKTR